LDSQVNKGNRFPALLLVPQVHYDGDKGECYPVIRMLGFGRINFPFVATKVVLHLLIYAEIH